MRATKWNPWDIFFDDQHQHCQSAAQYVSTGHVPNGIANKNPCININS
jgi:hypothetical protein